MSPDDPTDDLHKPLGQGARKKKKPFVLPVPVVTRAIAGLLGLCVAVLAGWILFVDEPFGGEPVAVVSALPKNAAERAAPTSKPDAAVPPSTLTESDKPAASPKTVTIIDGSTGKRQEVSVGQPGSPAAQKKLN